MSTKKYETPKYPRIEVNLVRHKKLHIEAQKEGCSMSTLVEAKLKLADKVLKGLKANEVNKNK